MGFHMQAELERLKKNVLALSAVVEEAVRHSVQSLKELDEERARSVLEKDNRIDELEVELEEECLKVLALHQPVAVDLRYIIAILKINNDLERIGDLAGGIAERTLALVPMKRIDPPFDFVDMASKVQVMLKKSLDSLVNLDAKLAAEVNTLDDEVDRIHAQNYGRIREGIERNPTQIDVYFNYLTLSRHLERIADLATNIAEDVHYMIQGEIVRHTSWGH